MASIKKRPDGKWRARFDDADGREHSKHFARKVDGERWLDEMTAALVTGTFVDPNAGKITFRAYAENWRLAAPHGPSMRDKVERALRLHVNPIFGDRPIGTIRRSHIQAWVTGLELAPSSAATVFAHVSSIFISAVKDKVIASNPAEDVRPPAVRRKDMYIPDLATINTLQEALPPRYRAVVDLAIGSGLRSGELFGLEVDALDFLRTRSVTVRQQLISLSPEPLHLAQVKTEESARTVPLAQPTLNALAAHLAEYPAQTVIIEDRLDPKRPKTRPAQLVFTTPAGSPISRSMWSQIWRPAARAAGIPERIGLHCLRHWYASALISGGESIKVVQKRMGHATAAITLDTYSHLMPDSDDRTRTVMEAALSAPADSSRTKSS